MPPTPISLFLAQVKTWAAQQPDIAGVLLVGSHARGTARPDSDVDLVILTTQPHRYLDSLAFAKPFGVIARAQTENWGNLVSQRIWYQDGFEVEFGITQPDWAALPLDEGTRRVISDGAQILFDRTGALDRLIAFVASRSA